MLIIFDVTPCSKVKYFSFCDKYNLIHLAKILMLTFYARKGWANCKKMTRGGYRINTEIQISILAFNTISVMIIKRRVNSIQSLR